MLFLAKWSFLYLRMYLFWTPVQMGLCTRSPRVKDWVTRHLPKIVQISTKQFTYNWPSPCQLRFKRNYFSQTWHFFHLLIRLFWPAFRIGLCVCMRWVRNRSLSHNPTIETATKSICPVPFSRIFVWKIFCKLLSRYLWQSLFLVKSHVFSIFFWNPLVL